jgi:predicted O-methyltransferase YrrM
MSQFEFTNTWFEDTGRRVWDQLIPVLKPTKILEIGSYEGASTCYLIRKLAPIQPLEIHCVDTWEGGIEHQAGGMSEANMGAVETRFRNNMKVAIESAANPVQLAVHKGFSHVQLAKLLATGHEKSFDMIYVDGSHQAPDVLCDAALSFRLLKVHGLLIFDDYLWSENLPQGQDPIRSPKVAIDAFTNIYCRHFSILSLPLYQLYMQKTSD